MELSEGQIDISKQRIERNDQVRRLESTTGWTKLTEYQQRLIKASLYLQDREDRHNPKNKITEDLISSLYCTSSLALLEGAKLDKTPTYPTDLYNKEPNSHPIKSESEFKDWIEQEEFPLVVILHRYTETRSRGAHDFLILGKEPNGKYLVWEKIGANAPYQIKNLESEFASDKSNITYQIRIRKLIPATGPHD